MNTLVSAFISNINNRDTYKYYQLGKLLLKTNVPKVIFVDIAMYNLIQDEDYDESITKLVVVNKSFLYLYDYIDQLEHFNLNTDNKAKDTIDYMFMMCGKTEWIHRAITMNPYKTDNFIWLDFGIRHVFKCSDDEFITKINNMKYKTYDKIRIGRIWDLNYISNRDIYKDITWYFAGGVFGGDINNLVWFADMMKEKCIDIMVNHNTIMWEVNIWYLVYNYNKNIFNPYKCDHNDSICDNY